MSTYQHSQTGVLVLIALGMGIVLSCAILILPTETTENYWVAAVVGGLLLCMFLFRTLNVKVDAKELEVWFGSGVIRKRIAVNEVINARLVKSPWYYGWGVRIIPGGWMFNVSGYDAVELELTNNRRFRIGTDDPEGLLAAIVGITKEAV